MIILCLPHGNRLYVHAELLSPLTCLEREIKKPILTAMEIKDFVMIFNNLHVTLKLN